MQRCHVCNAELQGSKKFCGKCGAKQELAPAEEKILQSMEGSAKSQSQLQLPKQQPAPKVTPNQAFLDIRQKILQAHTIQDLQKLQTQLHLAIEQFAGGKYGKQKHTILAVLDQLCTLEKQSWTLERLEELNNTLQHMAADIDAALPLKPLKIFNEVFSHIFSTYCKQQKILPIIQIEQKILGEGIADDVVETSFVVNLNNSTFNKLSHIRMQCTGIVQREEVVLATLEPKENAAVALPIKLRLAEKESITHCTLQIHYDWGVVRDIEGSQSIDLKRFHFQDFLQRHMLHGYAFPNPYIVDRPLEREHERLFVGREEETSSILTALNATQNTTPPGYIYGPPRIGKSSLLKHIASNLKQQRPCFVSLRGVDTTKQLDEIVGIFADCLLAGAQQAGVDVGKLAPRRQQDPHPVRTFEQLLNEISQQDATRPLVVLLDDFARLVAPRTKPILDLIQRLHQQRSVLWVMADQRQPEMLQQDCPNTTLFPLTNRALDFLKKEEVAKLLREPASTMGIRYPGSTVQQVFQESAGNPYLVTRIASEGIERLNAEHRTLLAPQDMMTIATRLTQNPATFTPAVSQLADNEERAAIHLARQIEQKKAVSLKEAMQVVEPQIIQSLQKKRIIEQFKDVQGDDYVRIRGNMLQTFLKERATGLTGSLKALPTPLSASAIRVGLFVDYENIQYELPGLSAQEIGQRLLFYAAMQGEVVCSWVCATPLNVRNWDVTKEQLQQVGFKIATPSDERVKKNAAHVKNVTDFVLIEMLNKEYMSDTRPGVYIIVSGDQDYYERIKTLIKEDYTVHLLSFKKKLAQKYRDLQERQDSYSVQEGRRTTFIVEFLDSLLVV